MESTELTNGLKQKMGEKSILIKQSASPNTPLQCGKEEAKEGGREGGREGSSVEANSMLESVPSRVLVTGGRGGRGGGRGEVEV